MFLKVVWAGAAEMAVWVFLGGLFPWIGVERGQFMPWEVESICAQGPEEGNDWVSIFVLWLLEYLLKTQALNL